MGMAIFKGGIIAMPVSTKPVALRRLYDILSMKK